LKGLETPTTIGEKEKKETGKNKLTQGGPVEKDVFWVGGDPASKKAYPLFLKKGD